MTRPNAYRRGYGKPHQLRRQRLEAFVASGQAVCPRCDLPISPDEPWDLGHDDYDRSLPTKPEHRACNRAHATRLFPSRDW